MDLRKLKTLIDLVADSDIAELEVTEGESKVRIVKSMPAPQNQLVMMPSHQPTATPVMATATPAEAPVPAAPAELTGHVIKSPMVGIFYRASAPGAAPYVDVGASVKEGDTLCIIEAMKLLNEIDADVAGTIQKVLVENGQPVEFGQPLFIIG